MTEKGFHATGIQQLICCTAQEASEILGWLAGVWEAIIGALRKGCAKGLAVEVLGLENSNSYCRFEVFPGLVLLFSYCFPWSSLLFLLRRFVCMCSRIGLNLYVLLSVWWRVFVNDVPFGCCIVVCLADSPGHGCSLEIEKISGVSHVFVMLKSLFATGASCPGPLVTFLASSLLLFAQEGSRSA